ncbi:PD-(D/E)XK nuclease family protein [Ethanoligenens sp.]|uniref:PD-(D/E)XK nuclease family protein n=1 Tax=Ethanoligenens sp. TaxID=2099655 RepID=UPI0039EC230D
MSTGSQIIVQKNIEYYRSIGIDIFKISLMDYGTFYIQREQYNIDLLLVSEEENFVICIENKVDSAEHDDQLNRYRTI